MPPRAPAAVYDVAIVGAGMVGAAVAALLRANPLTASMRLAIVDQQPPPLRLDVAEHPDLRVSTITPANMQMLQQAGAWDELAAVAPTFQRMQVWEHAGPGFISWHAADVGLPHMGCVVENRLLQAALLRAAQAAAGGGAAAGAGCLDLLCPQSVRALKLPSSGSPGGGPSLQQLAGTSAGADSSSSGGGGAAGSGALAELELADGSCLRARLVVAADGARSRVRALAGLRTTGWSYLQHGLVATVATAEPNGAAWQRFLPTGPLALLPVRGGWSSIVWTVTPDMAAGMERYSPQQLADAVNAALQPHPAAADGSDSSGAAAAAAAVLAGLGGALGRAPLLGPLLAGGGDASAGAYWQPPPLVTGWVGAAPKSFPLQLQHSGRYVAPRLALAGDAAHAIHPMAGQGVNLGLGDAAALASALAAARELGQDVGDAALLAQRYERPRTRANLAMMAALEGLWRGFGLQAALPGALRSAGMGLLNGAAPLKNAVMRFAMGV